GLCLGPEPSDPARPAHSTVRIVDPNDVRPGVAALHKPTPKLGRRLASHYAASSFNRPMMYASRAVSGMRREPSIRMEATVPAAISAYSLLRDMASASAASGTVSKSRTPARRITPPSRLPKLRRLGRHVLGAEPR